MSARADLLAVAGALAGEAKGTAITPDLERSALLVATVKTALEAATLAGDGEDDQRASYQEGWTVGFLAGQDAGQEAFEVLRSLCRRLELDFTTGDSETSRRLAARIHTALESAEQALGTKREDD